MAQEKSNIYHFLLCAELQETTHPGEVGQKEGTTKPSLSFNFLLSQTPEHQTAHGAHLRDIIGYMWRCIFVCADKKTVKQKC